MVYTENGTVEDFVIRELHENLDWTYVNPRDMGEQRNELFNEPLVVEDLKKAIRRINHYDFTEGDLDFIVVSLRTIPITIDGIRKFLEILRIGLVVPLQKEGKEKVIKIVDLGLDKVKNNEFVITNQYKVLGSNGNIRADLVLLVNGIPLVLVEAKNPASEQADWLTAYKQIKEYEEKAPELFKYVQFSIATDGIKTFYFPNAFMEEDEDFLNVWKDPYPLERKKFKENFLNITLYGLFNNENFLDLLENYVFVRKARGKSNKVMTRYMQYRASRKIFERVIRGLSKKQNGKFGLIWHWQGSGKTYTMAFAAWKLLHSPEAKSPSVFVMVDRKDLEEQIERDFAFLEIPIEKIGSIKKLIEILKWGKEGKRGIFLVTIEKFSPKEFLELEKAGEKIEIERENVIVLADEVHRTQYGRFSTMMRSVFKNAFVFGFTGTPLSKVERNTFQKFCPEKEFYLDRYSMLDAQDDGFTVYISYRARLPQYHLNAEQMKEFSEFEEEEIQKLSSDEKRELKRKVSVIREIAKDRDKIDKIAEDMAEHFKEVVEPTGLKAMIVTIDREACVLFKEAIDIYLPEDLSEIVMTPDYKKKVVRDYFQKLHEKYDSKNDKKIHEKIKDDFLNREKPKILIVTDMLITGFDAPNLWTMYMYKPLKEHRILQAIARTNRPFANKKFGMIVDYIGVLSELEDAYRNFEAGDSKALKVVIKNLEKEEKTFVELLYKVLKLFEGVKKKDTYESLESALDRLVDQEKAKKFELLIRNLMSSYEMLKGEAFLKDYLEDYGWVAKIYVAYCKKFKKANVDELKIDRLSRKTAELVRKTVDIKEIEKQYPTVEIDDKYLEALKRTAPKSLGAAIDIATNLIEEIKEHPTSPFFINLRGEVELIYKKLREKKEATEQEIKMLRERCKRVVDWKKEKEEIGEELHPLYEAMKETIPELQKKRIIDFTNDLLSHLKTKKFLFSGWQYQREMRRKVRGEIRIILLSRMKNHRDEIDHLTDNIFKALEGGE
ncbi:MAG: type I restriction endonuclease subunit R [Acidobacteriota bacterium]